MKFFKIISIFFAILISTTIFSGNDTCQKKIFAYNGFPARRIEQIERLKSLQEKIVIIHKAIDNEVKLKHQEIKSNLQIIEERIIALKKILKHEVETYDISLCLNSKNVAIYGSKTCPSCLNFIIKSGGFNALEPIYIECSDNPTLCREKMKTTRVPEIQINDIVYQGEKNIKIIARKVGCKN